MTTPKEKLAILTLIACIIGAGLVDGYMPEGDKGHQLGDPYDCPKSSPSGGIKYGCKSGGKGK